MKRYPVNENPIGSAVNEILRDNQTNKQTDRHGYTLYHRYIFLKISVSSYLWTTLHTAVILNFSFPHLSECISLYLCVFVWLGVCVCVCVGVFGCYSGCILHRCREKKEREGRGIKKKEKGQGLVFSFCSKNQNGYIICGYMNKHFLII